MKIISVWKTSTNTTIRIIRKTTNYYLNPTLSSCKRVENIIDNNRENNSVTVTPVFINIMNFYYK